MTEEEKEAWGCNKQEVELSRHWQAGAGAGAGTGRSREVVREKDYSCRGSLSRLEYFNLPSAIPNWALPPTATVLLSRSLNPSPRCALLHEYMCMHSNLAPPPPLIWSSMHHTQLS